MKAVTHITINLFLLVMLLIIFLNNQKKHSKAPDRRNFNVLTLLATGLMVFDILRYCLDGAQWQGAATALCIAHILYLICVVGVSGDWLIYVCARLKIGGSHERRRYVTWFVGSIGVVYILVAVTTPWSGLLFTISETVQYERGICYYLTYIISLLFLFTAMALIIRRWQKATLKEQRKECGHLLVCSFTPILGMVAQHMMRDWWVGATFVSLGVLYLYLNAQNNQIITDALTGLNNRGEFDQKIAKKAEQTHGSNWGLFMLDVDDFKEINDTQGHIVGDEALWETADILRRILGKERVFLARYGGDEFAVIGEWASEQEACAAIAKVENEVSHFNKTAGKAYQLSVSIGYAMWSEAKDLKKLVEIADERMYAVKSRKKGVEKRS